MEIVGVIYTSPDKKQYENFLAEISRFDIIGKPIFLKNENYSYRAMLKCRNSMEKSRIDSLVEKYKVRMC